MENTLDYHKPAASPLPNTLLRVATVLMFFPLLTLICLYGQWTLAWISLGHIPIPSLNDPKSIPGSSWMHPWTGLAIFGYGPITIIALGLHVLLLTMPNLSRKRVRLQLLGMIFIIVFTQALFAFHAGDVLYWWLD